VQWYVNVPAALIVIGVLVAPAATLPVSNPPPSLVEVCAVVSPLRHATVCPARIVVGLGE